MRKFICIVALSIIFFALHGITIAEASTPIYQAPRFHTVEQLVEWLETTDAENFQSGRFQNCLLSLRNHGNVFIPSFGDLTLSLSFIDVLPTHASRGELIHDGKMVILFVYSAPGSNRQLFVRVAEMNPLRINAYEAGGILEYLSEVRGEIDENTSVFQRTIPLREQATGEIIEQQISYSLLDFLDSITNPIASTVFIIDGFELGLTFYEEYHFNALSWEIVEITPSIAPVASTPSTALQAVHTQLTPRTIRFEIGETTYTINNIPHTSDVAPFIDPAYDRTMIPLRTISEALGAEVDWNPETRTVLISSGAASVNYLVVDVPLPHGMGTPVLIENRVFIPLRFVTELLDAVPRWDGANSAAYVYHYVMYN